MANGELFGAHAFENFASGSIPIRKAYLQSIISVIEVDDTAIRIKGNKDVLEKAILASRNGGVPGSQMSTGWRSLGGSIHNFWFDLSNSVIHLGFWPSLAYDVL